MEDIKIRTLRRLIRIRTRAVSDYPFFGKLLLAVQLGTADCGTACTDGKSIFFDPAWAERLGEEELYFVLMHEILHCVLCHPKRTPSPQTQWIYNIACDIVVNSYLLEIMGEDFLVDGTEPMHLAPDGKEGSVYSADQVYRMLLATADGVLAEFLSGSGIDSHALWGRLETGELEGFWKAVVCSMEGDSRMAGSMPAGMKREIDRFSRKSTTDWKALLCDFLQPVPSDYSFNRPDPRYQEEFFLPSLSETDVEKAENLFFSVDASGSVSRKALAKVFSEILAAMEQIGSLSGQICFFDTKLSDPVPFEDAEDLQKVHAVGGGGTSFMPIFDYLKEHEDALPVLLIILTDGYAPFPESDDVTLGVPTLWMIVDSQVVPPWGRVAYISSEE